MNLRELITPKRVAVSVVILVVLVLFSRKLATA